MFSPQVVNKFSLNLAGGYTAGTNGFEIGGLFNINKGDSRYLQLAGIFNLVGGTMTGLQLAGAHNGALDSVKGVQLSLFTNDAAKQLYGVQISALYNHTRFLKSLQIGLVNIADTSDGGSIGLVNIIRNGFYRVSYSATDVANTNFSLKTGTHRFYSAFLLSTNIDPKSKFYAIGLGIGHDFVFNDRFYISSELDYAIGNTGSWEDRWLRAKLLFNLQLSKNISLFGSPTWNRYSYAGSQLGYTKKFALPPDQISGQPKPVKRWTGWEAGISFNSVFKPIKK
jgi:hypothetical protein